MNFWEKLPNPFLCLAPMADVTDAAFRRIIAKYSLHGKENGGPHVFWTEFVSADGLMSPGREILKRDLEYSEEERPIVAQLFSSHPEKMRGAAKLCAELGFDGIDINMGCPDRSIEKQGAGAAMIKTPEIAAEIIQAAKDGIRDAGKDIPVSVKTRVGYNSVQINEWIPFLLNQDIAALTVHARTRKELSNVPARWDHVKEVVEIRDSLGLKTKIIGNGDVLSVEHGRHLAKETGCDGIMIGRAIFGNPWFFDETLHHAEGTIPENAEDAHKYWLYQPSPVSVEERLTVLLEHTKVFEDMLGDIKNFAIMKKHYKAYVNGFDGAKELRVKLMDATTSTEMEAHVTEFLNKK